MGGGNAQKTAMSRAKNQERQKKASGGTSQLKNNAAASSIICQICRASFLCTASQPKLNEHVESKHSKQGFAACFPEFGK